MWTAIPATSSPTSSHSPVCRPARTLSPSAATASTISLAQRTARAGPSKVARKPSPIVLTSVPRQRASASRTTVLCSSSSSRQRPSPSRAACSVEPTMSVNSTVASTRSGSGCVGAGRSGTPRRRRARADRPSRRCPRRDTRRTARPGSATATSRPSSIGSRRSSVTCVTRVGTRIVGSTARRSVWLIISISCRAMPGLAAERCIRPHHSSNARLPDLARRVQGQQRPVPPVVLDRVDVDRADLRGDRELSRRRDPREHQRA